jgi:DNA-binding response OmpR family regulator
MATTEDIHRRFQRNHYAVDAIAEGRLTPDEASALSLVAQRSMAVLSHQEILRRIEILEKDRELRDATKNFETA